MAAPTATSTVNLSNEAETAPTQVSLVMRVLRMLGDLGVQDVNTNNLTSSGTSVTVGTDATTRYQAGARLDWTEDGSFNVEIVSAVAATTLTIQAPRGANGSTAAAHDGSTTPKRFRVNPKFESHHVSEVVTQAIAGLWPEVYVVRDAIYTVTTTDRWFTAPAGTQKLISAYQYNTSLTPDEKVHLRYSQPNYEQSTDFTTGIGFAIDGVDANAGSLHVIHQGRVERTNLTARQTDIVCYEAAAYLLEEGYMADPRQGTPEGRFPFEGQKLGGWRRKAKDLRERERNRLRGFWPVRITPHIYSRSGGGHVRWNR